MHYHFIAIGGAVMHNLALELQALGHQVTGSDDEIFDPAKSRLEKAGLLPPSYGWFPQKIEKSIDAIILGMHARADNPELIRAKELNIPVWSFPEFIFEHSKNKTRVVIAGSHGKTTCTAMLMHVLKKAGIPHDYLVGSLIDGYDRMVQLSNAPLIIIEGDEYLTSPLHKIPKFLWYKPHLAMITGIAWDHINVFPTYQEYFHQFQLFLASFAKDAKWFFDGTDPELNRLNQGSSIVGQAYGLQLDGVQNDWETKVTIDKNTYSLPLIGEHNLRNAHGVLKIAEQLGVPMNDGWKYLSDFAGTAMRLQPLSKHPNRIIFRDFAHAPSKVKATTHGVKKQFPTHQIFAILELHTFSSLNKAFLPHYKGTLQSADQAWVLFDPEVFALKKLPLLTAAEIEQAFGQVKAFSNIRDLEKSIQEQLDETPTVLLFMSSGKFGGLDLMKWSITS